MSTSLPASADLVPLQTFMATAHELAQTRLRVAFRGQGNSTWALHSGAVRRLLGKLDIGSPEDDEQFETQYIDYHNNSLLTPARQRGFHIDSGTDLNDLQLLAKLQHFGAATGLLDFTLSPLAALWFACKEPGVDGAVLVLDITPSMNDTLSWDNLSSTSFTEIVTSLQKSSDLIGWEPSAFGGASPRITAQQSYFVLLHPHASPNRLLGTIPVLQKDKAVLLHQLQVFGIGQDTLFRDAFGFAHANSATAPLHQNLESATTLLDTANRHYLRGEYERAIAMYTHLLERFSDTEDIHFYRANAYAEATMNAEAIDDYNRALQHRERLARVPVAAVLFNRANLRARTDDHEAAIADYTETIALRGTVKSACFNRANSHFALGRFEAAISDYELTASYDRGAYNEGNAHMALGQFKAAIECYERALSLGWHPDQFLMDPPRIDPLHNNLTHARQLNEALKGAEAPRDPAMQAEATARAVHFKLPEGADPALLERQSIIVGNAGNIGNEGAPNLSGGEGSDGSNPFVIHFHE